MQLVVADRDLQDALSAVAETVDRLEDLGHFELAEKLGAAADFLLDRFPPAYFVQDLAVAKTSPSQPRATSPQQLLAAPAR